MDTDEEEKDEQVDFAPIKQKKKMQENGRGLGSNLLIRDKNFQQLPNESYDEVFHGVQEITSDG
jgi:hypothetical protein